MNCDVCGTIIEEGAKFCMSCGTKLKQKAVETNTWQSNNVKVKTEQVENRSLTEQYTAHYYPVTYTSPPNRDKVLTLSRRRRMVLGVCAGLAEYTGISLTLIRIFTLIAIFATSGIALLAYFILAAMLPREPNMPYQYPRTPGYNTGFKPF